MRIDYTVETVRAASRAWRREGLRVGFVPTMGALHAGHLSLVDAARSAGADRVVVSIFVNPTQFGPGEDLGAYPRDPDGDAARLRRLGVDLLFEPDAATIYPPGSETSVSLGRLPRHLCGRSRPVHFGGVATVVALLFNIVEPDLAVFGQKDYQQLQVIRRLVSDLHFAIEIVGAPIAREANGLAMSSRNAYLSADERARAGCLYRALTWARDQVGAGEKAAERLRAGMRRICEEAGGVVDYIHIVNPETLDDVEQLDAPARGVLAVQMGRARLIDNLGLDPPRPRAANDP